MYTVVAWEVVWEEANTPGTAGEPEGAAPPLEPGAQPPTTPPTESPEGDKSP
ncbi:MAG: hypothetical protein IT317_01065 [Anaerolineales bacterium]|nr:hypothetical protein [Anaerolineales bacterium]